MRLEDSLSLVGRYTLTTKEKGHVVDQREIYNTITDAGRTLFYDFLTGKSSRFINYVAVGLANPVLNTPVDILNTKLDHEIYRARMESKGYDLLTNTVSFYATLPPERGSGVIEEIGVFDRVKNDGDSIDDVLISDFNDVIDWSFGVTELVVFKEGDKSVKVQTDSTLNTLTKNASFDFSSFSATDKVQLILQPSAGLTILNIEIRFHTDTDNYYKFIYTTPLADNIWTIIRQSKEDFTPNGTPDWADINQVSISITKTDTTAVTIYFGSMRFIATGGAATMFSRQAIAPPLTKSPTQELLVKYDLIFT